VSFFKNIKQNHFLYTTALLLAVLPIKKLVVPVLLLAIVSWLITDSFSSKVKKLRENRTFWLFVLPFFLYLFGMLYSSNQPFGWKDIELKLSLLIFPLFYASTSFPLHRFVKQLGIVFVYSMSIAGLSSILYGLFVFKQIPTYSLMDLFLHPTYLAMYANLALAITYFLFYRKDLKQIENVLLRIAFLILSVTTLLTLSKTGLIVWLLLIGLMLFYNLIVIKKQYFGSLLLVFFSISLIVTAYYTVPEVRNRFYYAFEALGNQAKNQVDTKTTESTQVRMLVWQQAIEIVKENPLLGTGTGDIKDELYIKYEKEGMQGALDNKLNVHNHYLQLLATLGFIGFTLFMASLIIPSLIALKNRNRVYLAFILIFSINILFESMWEKQDGVVFYAFLNALIFFHGKAGANPQSALRS